ncbi:MAG: hypothetical protein JNL08_17815 [Planctomycetes bacterium]|nr:hypothetical protein [Planctomycetota bacterium]
MQETAVSTKKKSKSQPEAAAPPDPREPLAPTAANLQFVVTELEKVLADVPPPKLAAPAEGEPAPVPPPGDLVEAMLHIYFADGLPCGYGQEARRRIQEGFVDRNEFRVTEAFEVEDLLRDLEIPNLFDRCLAVRDSVAQIYNDQNGVNLAFLRDAGIGDRNTFFQRVPALQPHAAQFLNNLLTLEELCFSDKSTLRAQQRLGLDPKDAAANKFLDRVRALLKPYGQLPLDVGPHLAARKPNLTHPLSPACLLARLAPAGKRR